MGGSGFWVVGCVGCGVCVPTGFVPGAAACTGAGDLRGRDWELGEPS